MVDSSENGLTELTRDLRSTAGQVIPDDFRTYPIALGTAVFDRLLASEGPFDVVADFAAHKHVRSEKDRFSIEALLHTNVIDTVALLDALLASPPERFFCVSTDKAANPANVMGASKKLMEDAIIAYAGALPATTARLRERRASPTAACRTGSCSGSRSGQPLSAPAGRAPLLRLTDGERAALPAGVRAGGARRHPVPAAWTSPRPLTFASIADALLEELGYTPVRLESEEDARRSCRPRTEWPVYYFESDTSGEKPVEEFHTDDEVLDLDRFRCPGCREGDAGGGCGRHPPHPRRPASGCSSATTSASPTSWPPSPTSCPPSSTSRPAAASTRGCRCTG